MMELISGKKKRPFLVFLYGPEGVGKTTFGSNLPMPLFITTEDGTDNLDVVRLPKCATWDQFVKHLISVRDENHNFRTLIIDTIDGLEPLLWRKICEDSGAKSIELACGGYGKGYIKAQEEFLKVRDILDQIRNDKQMNICLLAHSTINKFADPITNLEYDTYKLKLHKRTISVFVEWVDLLLFCNYDVYTKNEKIFGNGERVIYTEKRPSHDAKNRFGLELIVPLDGKLFTGLMEQYFDDKTEELKKMIAEKMELLKPEIKEKVMVAFNNAKTQQNYQQILDRLNTLLGV